MVHEIVGESIVLLNKNCILLCWYFYPVLFLLPFSPIGVHCPLLDVPNDGAKV